MSGISKQSCMVTGCVDYFRNGLAAIGEHSKYGNDKHNPGEPMHWAFDKSTEHADAVLSHLSQRGEIDPETGKSHTISAAWRMLALLETELIAMGAKPGPAVRRCQAPAAPDYITYTVEYVNDPFASLKGSIDVDP